MDSKTVKKLADKCSAGQRETGEEMGKVMSKVAYDYLDAHPGCNLKATDIMSKIGREFAARKKFKAKREEKRKSEGGAQIPLFADGPKPSTPG